MKGFSVFAFSLSLVLGVVFSPLVLIYLIGLFSEGMEDLIVKGVSVLRALPAEPRKKKVSLGYPN